MGEKRSFFDKLLGRKKGLTPESTQPQRPLTIKEAHRQLIVTREVAGYNEDDPIVVEAKKVYEAAKEAARERGRAGRGRTEVLPDIEDGPARTMVLDPVEQPRKQRLRPSVEKESGSAVKRAREIAISTYNKLIGSKSPGAHKQETTTRAKASAFQDTIEQVEDAFFDFCRLCKQETQFTAEDRNDFKDVKATVDSFLDMVEPMHKQGLGSVKTRGDSLRAEFGELEEKIGL